MNTLKHYLICKPKGWIATIQNFHTLAITGAGFSGCDMVEVESTPLKQVLRCEVCGKETVGYYDDDLMLFTPEDN